MHMKDLHMNTLTNFVGCKAGKFLIAALFVAPTWVFCFQNSSAWFRTFNDHSKKLTNHSRWEIGTIYHGMEYINFTVLMELGSW